MGKLIYITGTSRGIGNALATAALQSGYQVVGLSRTNTIQHDDFKFIQIDLSDLEQVKSFRFTRFDEETILVNNAGTLGEINTIGKISDDSIHKVMTINTISPQILSNNFIRTFSEEKGNFMVLNISSGAGKRAVTSWAAYCASKAAIDLFSETVGAELKWLGLANWRIYSCAPGIVDTDMQEDIRATNANHFQEVQKFIDYNQNGELSSTEEVAQKLIYLIGHPAKFNDVVISVRDF